MKILLPMAGEGRRFADAGYAVRKPAIPTTNRRTGDRLPMVVCAVRDLPDVAADGANVIFVERAEDAATVEPEIRRVYPAAHYLTVDHLTEGQASTCLLARELIDDADELLIAGCDNGMVYDVEAFAAAKHEADMLVFTYRHNEAVLQNPDAYGWMRVDAENHVTGVSIKKAISDHPMDDHAVVATFWFRHGHDFVRAADRMIAADDRVNGEFYVDEVTKHAMELGLSISVFEIARYIGWGTPYDYEAYEKTLAYWRGFVTSPYFRPRD